MSKAFRTIDHLGLEPRHVRNANTMPLILIKPDGEVAWAQARGEKDALVAAFNPKTDTLLMAWPGQWRQDLFKLSPDDLELIYR